MVRKQVRIESGFTQQVWEGPIEFDEIKSVDRLLDDVFRMFNRVTDQDVKRLSLIGFKQPSLSVGDIVELDGERWQVAAPTGFNRVGPEVKADPLRPLVDG